MVYWIQELYYQSKFSFPKYLQNSWCCFLQRLRQYFYFSSNFILKDLLYFSKSKFSELCVAANPEDRKKCCQNDRVDVINDKIG